MRYVKYKGLESVNKIRSALNLFINRVKERETSNGGCLERNNRTGALA